MEKRIEENDEEYLYERFRAIAEEEPDRRIALLVRSETEIKAAYRAAVYGEISLLFDNIFTEEDAKRAKECARRAFCELLEGNHEFNGFLPKGILINTPLALLSNLSTQGFDFVCYDKERISFLLIGEKSTVQKNKKILQSILSNNINPKIPCQTIDFQTPLGQRVWKYAKE